MRPRNNSTLPNDNRRPLSIVPKNTSPTRNRPVVSNSSRDDPRSPTSYSSRDEGSRYLVPASSHGREHHQRHYSATRADIDRVNAVARGERSRGQYHQAGGYNQKAYSASRPTIKDEDFSYTGPREQFARDYPANQPSRRDTRPPRPVSVMELSDHRPSVAASRRDMPPPSSTRQLDRLDRPDGGRLSIRPGPEPDLDRVSDLPQRRQSTRQPVVHQSRDDGYIATRDDIDARPSNKSRRDRLEDDEVPAYRSRRERADDEDMLPPPRPRKDRIDEVEQAPRPRRERAEDDDVLPPQRPRKDRVDDVEPLPRSRRERPDEEDFVPRPKYRDDDRDRARERDYQREPEREVRDRDRDRDYPREPEREVRERDRDKDKDYQREPERDIREREREKDYSRDGDREKRREHRDRDSEKDSSKPHDRDRERDRVKSPDSSKSPDDLREVRSHEDSSETQGAGKGVVAGLGGLAAAGLAGAAIKSAQKSEDASDSETRKERRHRKHRHRDRHEDDEEADDADPRERRRAQPEDKASDELRPPPARRDESASESHEEEHGHRRRRRHRHRDRDETEASAREGAQAEPSQPPPGEQPDAEMDDDRYHRRRQERVPVPYPVGERQVPDMEDDRHDRRRQERAASRVREQGTEELERRTISPGENEDDRPRRVQLVEPEKKEEFKPKGILKKPREQPFPEDPNPTREGVAPLKDAGKEGVPPNARWTKISRVLVNPEALEQAHERFEERDDYVIVLRVVSREEIAKFAEKTREIRGMYFLSRSQKMF